MRNEIFTFNLSTEVIPAELIAKLHNRERIAKDRIPAVKREILSLINNEIIEKGRYRGVFGRDIFKDTPTKENSIIQSYSLNREETCIIIRDILEAYMHKNYDIFVYEYAKSNYYNWITITIKAID